MPTVSEATTVTNSPLANELAAGVNLLSGNQTVTFTPYIKLVFPTDGFVYWIRHDLIPITAEQITVMGSLHFTVEVGQEEDSTISYDTIVFTAESQVDLFNQVNPQVMYLATYDNLRFSFSSAKKFYQQANLWHYIGVAVTSILETQIIDDVNKFNSITQVISNSLPIWLAMPSYTPPYPGFTCPIANVYPSKLVPENAAPPYASIHIEETTALASAAFLGRTLSSSQLTKDKVRVTTYGVNNDDIVTFLNFVLQYSFDWNYIGILNMPIIYDDKKEQAEIQTIAQKKIIEFDVSYLQESVRNVARQFILKATIHFIPMVQIFVVGSGGLNVISDGNGNPIGVQP